MQRPDVIFFTFLILIFSPPVLRYVYYIQKYYICKKKLKKINQANLILLPEFYMYVNPFPAFYTRGINPSYFCGIN